MPSIRPESLAFEYTNNVVLLANGSWCAILSGKRKDRLGIRFHAASDTFKLMHRLSVIFIYRVDGHRKESVDLSGQGDDFSFTPVTSTAARALAINSRTSHFRKALHQTFSVNASLAQHRQLFPVRNKSAHRKTITPLRGYNALFTVRIYHVFLSFSSVSCLLERVANRQEHIGRRRRCSGVGQGADGTAFPAKEVPHLVEAHTHDKGKARLKNDN